MTTHTFVFSKARALAMRIPIEQNKKQAAHTVCQRLLALLSLSKSPSPLFSMKPQAVQSSSQAEPVERYSLASSLAGTFERKFPLGYGVRA